MLSEYHDEDLTIPVSVVFLCSFGMLGPKCWWIDLQRASLTLLQALLRETVTSAAVKLPSLQGIR